MLLFALFVSIAYGFKDTVLLKDMPTAYDYKKALIVSVVLFLLFFTFGLLIVRWYYRVIKNQFMIEAFLNKFSITTKGEEVENEVYKDLPPDLFQLIQAFGGSTFNNGLYRLHSFQSSIKWAEIIGEYFPQYKGEIYPFGFDWKGRQFCMGVDNEFLFLFDPASAEDFELDQSLALLHNEDFVDYTDDLLASNTFNELLSLNDLKSIDHTQCLGYRTPLFLGGADEVNNYEVQDMEVYWHIAGQIYHKIKDLPDGTNIGNITIE